VLPGGAYDLYLSVGDIDGTPRAQMPLAEDHPADRRYHIGKLTVTGDYDVRLVSAEVSGGELVTVLEYTGHSEIPDTNRPNVEFFNANAPKWGDQLHWLAGADFAPYESDWTEEKRLALNGTGKALVTFRTRIDDPHYYGKTYALHAGMLGTDGDIFQSGKGKVTVAAFVDISETGDAAVRDALDGGPDTEGSGEE
jgi:hypothetical protein